MTPKGVCLWCHREHGDSNERGRPRQLEPSEETGVKKMTKDNVSSELVALWFACVYEAASSIQNFASPLVFRLKKYKNGNSARRSSTQRYIRSLICYGDNFSLGISGNFQKLATLTQPNGIFQNCVHSISTLSFNTWDYSTQVVKSGNIDEKISSFSRSPVLRQIIDRENNTFQQSCVINRQFCLK